MKNLSLIFITAIIALQSNAQFSVRRNTLSGNSVDILYTAPLVGRGNVPVQYFSFALSIPNPQGATLTATFTPGAPLAAIAAFQPSLGTDGLNRTFAWASIGVPTYANTFNFTASEVILGTVAFTPSAGGAVVSAVDYQNAATYGGPGTGVAFWSMQVTPGGLDVTNYGNLFYQSGPSGGTPGSSSPSTLVYDGASNQIVTLGFSVLPLQMADFAVTNQDCNPLLSWKTTAERNTKNFEIEQSIDGTNFKTIGTLNALGNSNVGKNYSYLATQPQGKAYYRLKINDDDGGFKYSSIQQLTIDCSKLDALRIYPSPARENTNVIAELNTNYSGLVLVQVTSMDGRLVYSNNATLIPGINKIPVPSTKLVAGTYLIQVITPQGARLGQVQKLIKE